MTEFNPFAGAILGSSQAQSIAGTERQRQLRRSQALRKDIAAREDTFEHQVESAEELHPVDDGDPNRSNSQDKRGRQQGHRDDEQPQIDLKA